MAQVGRLGSKVAATWRFELHSSNEPGNSRNALSTMTAPIIIIILLLLLHYTTTTSEAKSQSERALYLRQLVGIGSQCRLHVQ